MKNLIIPTMRYKDADSAIKWLCDTLGFEVHVVHRAEQGWVANAQLKFGEDMIMLSTQRDSIFDNFVGTPNDQDGMNTQTAFLVVTADELQSHYNHAKSSGAEMVVDLMVESYGAGYTCRDPEGYLWNIGDYNPWET